MTIDELLNVASKNIGFAMLTNTIDQQERAICAAIAQAAAQTAQAMIMRDAQKVERDAARAEASFNRALVNKGAGDIKTLLGDTLELQAQLDKAIAERVALRELLDDILNHSVANRGTKDAFFRCYAYRTGEMPEWVKRAEDAIA